MGTEKGHQVQLSAAQLLHNFRRQIQVGAFIVMHFTGAVEAMHKKRRKNEQLVRFQGVELIVHTHVLSAVTMNIKLEIVMTVILCDGHTPVNDKMRFIA